MPTCTVPTDANTADPLWHTFTLHHLLIVVGATCALVTCLFSLLLIIYHLRNYTKPNEQRQIIRLVFTPFVFAVFSLLAVAFYDYSIYMESLQGYYEAFALVAIFMLFVHFVTPSESRRENFYHDLERKSRKGVPKAGGGGSLKWFHTIWIGVFQYILGHTITTLVTIITQAAGVYCESSNSAKFAHIWVTIIQTVDTVFTIVCIITFYRRLKPEMASHKPLSKLVAFKAIVFLSLIQNLFFSFMISRNHFHPTSKISYNDLSYGIPAALVCVEMTLFSIAFFFVFPARPYSASSLTHHPRPSFSSDQSSGRSSIQHLTPKPASPPVQVSFAAALFDALNPVDYIHGLRYAVQVLFGMKKRGGTRQATIHLEAARGEGPYDSNYYPQQGQGLSADAARVLEEARAGAYGYSGNENGRGRGMPPHYV